MINIPFVIWMYSGTIGSGKSYHTLEDIVKSLEKGKHVIANFPLTFTAGQIRRGLHKRFMYLEDKYLMGVMGIRAFIDISRSMGWDETEEEGLCLVAIDEATNFWGRDQKDKDAQELWRTFFTQSRKFGYDFILIVQDDNSINKTVTKCIEYDVKHRKANNIFPFSLLKIFKITLFFYIKFWKQQRTRLGSNSSFFIPRLAKMYKHKKLFANLDERLDKFIKMAPKEELLPAVFGNSTELEVLQVGGDREAVGTACDALNDGSEHTHVAS